MDNGHVSIEEIEQLIQQKGPAEHQSHVEICQQCGSLLEKSRAFSARLVKLASVRFGAGGAMNCPDERVWFDVSGGTLPEADSLKHVQHAAECSSCSQKLKAATRMFEEELSAEEEKALAALPGTRARVQRELAERLAGTGGKSVPVVPKRSFWRPFSFSLAGAAVAIVAVLIFASVNRHDSPADVERLLAQAYTENRTIEMRIPYAKRAEIRQQRSANGSAYSDSESFHKAAAAIAAQLSKRPNDPQWLMLQAERDLLDWKYSEALSIIGRVGNPAVSSPEFELMHALAVFEQAESEQTPGLYGQVYELLDKLLQKNPDNTVILFDHALACERNNMVEGALDDWRRLLQIEPSGGWADEARSRLKILEEKKTPAILVSAICRMLRLPGVRWPLAFLSTQPRAKRIRLSHSSNGSPLLARLTIVFSTS